MRGCRLLVLRLGAAALVAVVRAQVFAATPGYPGASWERLDAPEALAGSPTGIKAARDYCATINTAAVC